MGERALVGGRYELGPAIGSGGFSTVFRARDRQSSAEVAVKLVPPGASVGYDSSKLAARLESEASVLKRLSSRHVARILESGSDASGVWLVTELVDGVPLSADGLGRPLFPHEVLRVARGLLEGLAAAHAASIVHGDVKPSNILVPRTKDGLDSPKLIDFGLARVTPRADITKELGDDLPPRSEVVLGTARYMAPELLAGGAADPRSDVYAAGLVLFELLGEGDLFMTGALRDQLRARMNGDPDIEDRVPAPLSIVLAKMLARDPARRYADASEALGEVLDLDTAPVSVIGGADEGRAARASSPISASLPPTPSSPVSFARPLGSLPPAARMNALPEDGVDGLRDTLRFLDLPMLDALARRERGNTTGRVARGVALALRLELDAAALILEPLAMQSDVARAVGATILAPRARRVTRARVDSDREDTWLDTVPAELGALLASFAASIAPREDASRDVARISRALARLDRVPASDRVDTTRTTARIALIAARVKAGELAAGSALDLAQPLEAPERGPRFMFDRVVRALCSAVITTRLDEGRARDELERAVRAANESGATLLEACASATWGRLLIDAPLRAEQGLAVLERTSTLLAHGDAPTLEHEAEHHRAAALVMAGRWTEAVPRLQAAREAAHAERAVDAEMLSASLEVLAHLASGDPTPAREAALALGAARIGSAGGRAAALAWIARSIEALASGDREAAEDAHAEASARAREAGAESADAFVLVEVLALLFDAARAKDGGATLDVHATTSELERFASEHGFSSFYWLEVLRSVVDRIVEPDVRSAMRDVLPRITVLLGPASRSRDRRTSAPPPLHD